MDVLPEWDITRRALGGFEDVERFVRRAFMRLNAALTNINGLNYSAPLALLPEILTERFQAEGLMDDNSARKPVRIAFEARPPAGFLSVHRAHPLPGILAETFLETAIDRFAPRDVPSTLPRCGVWETEAVDEVTTLLLVRIRHRIDSRGKLGPKFSMAEEAGAIAFIGGRPLHTGEEAFALLEAESASVPEGVRQRELANASAALGSVTHSLNNYAAERARALADDHTRVRQALGSKAAVKVQAVTPVDIIGLYVLMPKL